MISSRFQVIRLIVLLTLLPLLPLTSPTSSREKESPILRIATVLTRLFWGCLRQVDSSRDKDVMADIKNCLKRRSLVALDRVGTMDHLRIYEGIELVKSGIWSVDEDRGEVRANMETSWSETIAKKLDVLFKTHLLKFHVKPGNFLAEARRRRYYKDLMPILIFGILAVSMIAIPLGFQFLAVLGGKALLLAKLALILTSIQGLKKIATSSFNYGLYQVPQANAWSGYDRRLQFEAAGDLNKYQGYQQPDAVLDLLHPLSPRSTSGYDQMQYDDA